MNYYQDHLYVNFDVNLTGGQSSNNNSTSNGHDSDFASLTGRRREVQRDSLGESFRESQRELRRNSEREVLRRNSEREVLRRNTPGTSERELFRRNSEREQLLRQESQRDAQHSENHVTTSAL